MPSLPVVALFGPTGVGKTEVAVALAERLRARRRGSGRRLGRRAPALRRAARSSPARPSPAQRARLEHRLLGVLPRHRARHRRAPTRAARTRRSTRWSPPAGARSSSAAPACTCARRSPSSRCGRRPTRRSARACGAVAAEGAPALHAELDRARPAAGGGRSRRRTPSASCARSSCSSAARRPGGRPAVDRARRGTRRCSSALVMDRDGALPADRRPRRGDARRRRGRGGAPRGRRRRVALARQALGFEELLRGDAEAMRVRTRRYAKRQLTWLRKLPGAHVIDVTGRDARRRGRRAARRARPLASAGRCGSRSGRRWATTT